MASTLSTSLGWIYFIAWSISFYPQIYLNETRPHSRAGFSLDFALLNVLGFAYLSTFNVYFFIANERYVEINDVAFAIHALCCSSFILSQTSRLSGFGKISTVGSAIGGMTVFLACAFVVVLRPLSYGITSISYLKIFISVSKYVPQVSLNSKRKSTAGFSMLNVLFDFIGGVCSIAQLCVDAHDRVGSGGDNVVKAALGVTSIVFDVVFFAQRAVFGATAAPDESPAAAHRPLLSFSNPGVFDDDSEEDGA